MRIEVQGGNYFYARRKEEVPYLYQTDINFSLNDGEIMAILGPNGAGKTTMLKCITGLLDWKKGQTFIDGKPLPSLSRKTVWKRIGYVPQAHNMVFGFTLEELVIMGRAPYISALAQPSVKDREVAHLALETVGIGHLAGKSCNTVSGGELQLALIARTLVSDPEVLILDEPESHLDVQKQVVILQTLKRLSQEKKISCIINTHYPNHAFFLADHVLMTAKQKPVVYGEVQEVMTESRMKEYFGIEMKKIIYEEDENFLIETMVPKDLGIPRDQSTCRFTS
ncbi:ABC transporter ATP-binding protein [Peribacillus butanolivorans]|uniref:ABC transporter ATP-binding protein n=1 Tax=Peribacillus butanolivorans TaxID=421767 RepID=UPI0035E10675